MPLCLMYSHPPTHTNSLCHSHSLALTTTHPPIPILSHTPICMHTHTRTPMHTHVISRTQMLPVFKSSSGEPHHLTLDWSSLSRSLFHNLLIRPSEQNPDDGLNGWTQIWVSTSNSMLMQNLTLLFQGVLRLAEMLRKKVPSWGFVRRVSMSSSFNHPNRFHCLI